MSENIKKDIVVSDISVNIKKDILVSDISVIQC